MNRWGIFLEPDQITILCDPFCGSYQFDYRHAWYLFGSGQMRLSDGIYSNAELKEDRLSWKWCNFGRPQRNWCFIRGTFAGDKKCHICNNVYSYGMCAPCQLWQPRVSNTDRLWHGLFLWKVSSFSLWCCACLAQFLQNNRTVIVTLQEGVRLLRRCSPYLTCQKGEHVLMSRSNRSRLAWVYERQLLKIQRSYCKSNIYIETANSMIRSLFW